MARTGMVRVKGLKPSVSKFTVKLHENMTRLWNDATREFVRVVALSDLIHVDTGMSRASLLPLARAVNMLTVVRATINPKHDSRTGSWNMDGSYNPTKRRSIAAGEAAGQRGASRGFTLNYGSTARPVFHFQFNIKVYQYWLHENSSYGSGGGPWKTIEKGMDAFTEFLKNNSAKYVPKLSDWILPTTTLGP